MNYELCIRQLNKNIPCVYMGTEKGERLIFNIGQCSLPFSSHEIKIATSVHVHNFYLILWCIEGICVHYIDSVQYELEPNTIAFVNPNSFHRFISEKEGIVHYITFNADFIELLGAEIKRFVIVDLFSGLNIFRISSQNKEKVETIFNELLEESKNHSLDCCHSAYIVSLMKMLFISLKRWLNDEICRTSKNINSMSYTIYEKFCCLIEKNFRETHSIYTYAHKLNLSTCTLNKYVKIYAGKNAVEVLNNRIIYEAQKLLVYSNYSVYDISIKLAFTEATNFTKFFKRRVGMSPNEYRKQFTQDI